MGKFNRLTKNRINNLPKTAGVYAFKKDKTFLYVGKAVNIKQRVKNHFQSPVFKDSVFLPKTDKIGYIKTNSEIEALLLEAELIKKHQPKYNVEWKDGKNYFYVIITKENFPRVFITHQVNVIERFKIYDLRFKIKNKENRKSLFVNHKSFFIGPFVDGAALKQTLRILRRVFPYRTCKSLRKKPCLYRELNLCLAPCKLKVQNLKLKKEYKKNIKNLILVLQGKKKQVLNKLKKEMKQASKEQDYKKAANLRDQIKALENVFAHIHIFREMEAVEQLSEFRNLPNSFLDWFEIERQLQKLLGSKDKIKRIEGYDISNIQGSQAAGSMVVFEYGKPNKNQYRKFKIKFKQTPDDIFMLKEVLSRRLKHKEWSLPELMLIDGGKGQFSAALAAKLQMSNDKYQIKSKCQMTNTKKIKIMALAKRKNELFIEGKAKPILLKNLSPGLANLILRIRDEAHRFALSYHRGLRRKAIVPAA